MNQDPNLEQTRAVARQLEPLLPELVFVGGCVAGLLLTDPAAAPARPTKDVDVVAEIVSYAEWEAMGERLRELGFETDSSEGAPICRWVSGQLRLDVMPLKASILGFTNRWYRAAINSAVETDIGDGLSLRIVSAPLFLATKLEAFRTRGGSNFGLSHDLEDIIAIIDGRAEVGGEVEAAPEEVRAFLVKEFGAFFDSESFRESLPGHLMPDAASQARLEMILERVQAISLLT